MPTQPDAEKFKVTIDGSELPADVDHLLTSAMVDHNLLQPDYFVLRFQDPDRIVLTKTGIKIGSVVKITVVSDLAPGGGDALLDAEVTALDAEHDSTGTFTVVRGYDQSHRLLRGGVTESYQNVSASDVANKVAHRHGLGSGQIDSSGTVHDHIGQGNLSDWQFLQMLASDIGFEVSVVDRKLNFRKPVKSDQAPGDGDLNNTSNPLQLTLGAHLLRLRATVTSSEQVGQVQVRGWDPASKQVVVGTSPAGTTSADVGVTPSSLASKFGNPTLVGTTVPYATQGEADAAAKAMADHIAGSFAEVEGLARGNSKLRAGQPINLSLLGDPFNGKYTLTSTRHVFDHHEGYTTAFTVSGRNQRSLLGLAAGGGGGGPSGGTPRIAGVVVGIVTDIKDPKDLGRVKLKFPWLSDDYVADWARMTQAGAGNNRGAVFMPEVGDEVLVAFEQGDFNSPFVIGGLYNGVDKPMLGSGLVDGSTGAVTRRGLISKKGHSLIFFDGDGNEGVSIMTGDKGMKISLNKTKTTINITSSGQIKIEGSQDVSIKAGGSLTVEATSKLSLKGASVSISGDADVSVSGNPIKLN